MKKVIIGIVGAAAAIACLVLYFTVGPRLDNLQLETGLVLIIITSVSALYCFVVGEITRNNSQMDKLWSILPIAYTWVIAAKGGMSARLVIIAVLVTLWGIRLTFNFARKGAYRIKFWEGEEDYRWVILRRNPLLNNRFKWALFDLFFISIYQNVLVLLITLPALACMSSTTPVNYIDFIAAGLCAFFLIMETIADEQQHHFQTHKWNEINAGKKLEELEEPYNLGFNTFGLWNHARHPNYLCEQMFWISLYVFSIAAGIGIYNYSLFGAALLVTLFCGSVTFGEKVSSSKYPLYSDYMKKTTLYIPFKKYRK